MVAKANQGETQGQKEPNQSGWENASQDNFFAKTCYSGKWHRGDIIIDLTSFINLNYHMVEQKKSSLTAIITPVIALGISSYLAFKIYRKLTVPAVRKHITVG
jgi:hypothetical protein